MSIDQSRAPGQRSHLSQELAGTLVCNGGYVSQPVTLGDRDMAADDDEHAATDFAGPEQALAIGVTADRSKAPQTLDLLRRQAGEHLVVARLQCRRKVGGYGIVRRVSLVGHRVIRRCLIRLGRTAGPPRYHRRNYSMEV